MEELNAHIQDCAVLLSITDTDFCSQTYGILKPEHLASSVAADCLRICHTFFEHYNKAPKDHFNDELEHFLARRRKDNADLYVDYLERLQEIGTPQADYILSRLNDFITAQELQIALVDVARMLDNDNTKEAKKRIMDAVKTGVESQEVGTWLKSSSNYQKWAAEVDKESGEVPYLSKTGIQKFDELIGGFERDGELVCIVGREKVGKTWFMQLVAKTAMKRGLKVLHISHEMTERQLEKRYYQMIGALHTRSTRDEPLHYVYWGDPDIYVDPEDENAEPNVGILEREVVRPSLYNKKALEQARRVVMRFPGELLIKKFPMASTTIEQLNEYLQYLETFEDFRPDVIINDYADIMRHSPHTSRDDVRHRLNDIWMGHKRIADEKKCLVVTGSQIPKAAEKQSRPSQKAFAEDKRKSGNVDKAIFIWQSEEDEPTQIAEVYMVLNRNGTQGVWCKISQCKATGQFCVSSWIEDNNETGNPYALPNQQAD